MKRYIISHRNGIDGLVLQTDAPVPELRSPTDIRIKIKALSLNARDIQIVKNEYPAPHDVPQDCVPISDGCGIVEAVGDAVTLFKVGDQVSPVFPQGYHHVNLPLKNLKRGLGGAIDGVAAEYFVCDEEEAIKIPSSFTPLEGSTFSVASATAWSSLYSHHPKLQAGQTVLCLGTGGVSLCAAQIALVSGARVILTSSSQTKLDRAAELLKPLVSANAPANVIQTIDYSKIEAWDAEARRLNGGNGVDFVIEIAGRATLARSIRSTKQGGLVAISGYMGDYKSIPDHIIQEDLAKTILYSAANVRGVFVCNREDYKTMVSALEVGEAKPIIDKVFKFQDLKEAYKYVDQGKHMGKVCIEL
ncbi:alcohol dehydrogenase [Kwoniella heveanensis CBS 569]|uniref:Alcohol dehydrogenase n=1 Tax=Kwoniella heveanensis BCC8398 TaxID=1296120 RepID=A0A1B9GYH0_9TREE|nr:alcohol dehydrogenase [Kwoniella heveanensis BCC8398]OCF44228.1 alcohol dehydrogenase [Kwoniella heveanensis CBS 569]